MLIILRKLSSEVLDVREGFLFFGREDVEIKNSNIFPKKLVYEINQIQ